MRIEGEGAIEILTLDRPAALNALDSQMVDALIDYFEGLADRREVRVVLLRGEGRAFCAGADLKAWAAETREDSGPSVSLSIQRRFSRMIRAVRACPQPVIGLGHGYAYGGGFALLLACDVRIGAPSLRLQATFLKIGLGGADVGVSYLLPRLVGLSIAAETLLTGRVIDGDRALRMALLSELVSEAEVLPAGLRIAREMLAAAPLALSLTKEALNHSVDARSIEAAMAVEDRQQVILTMTRDHEEAVRAFAERREPRFDGR